MKSLYLFIKYLLCAYFSIFQYLKVFCFFFFFCYNYHLIELESKDNRTENNTLSAILVFPVLILKQEKPHFLRVEVSRAILPSSCMLSCVSPSHLIKSGVICFKYEAKDPFGTFHTWSYANTYASLTGKRAKIHLALVCCISWTSSPTSTADKEWKF